MPVRLRRRRAHGGSSGSVIPPPAMWLKASSLGLADGAAVSSLVDSSGNGHTFAQATPGSQPVYTAAASPLAGKPGITFDGSRSLTGAGPAFNAASHSLFVAFRPKSGGPTGSGGSTPTAIGSGVQSGGSPITITVPAGGVSAGLLVTVRTASQATMTADIFTAVTDSRGNTYTKAESAFSAAAGGQDGDIWYSFITTALLAGDTISVTLTLANGAQYGVAAAEWWSGSSGGTFDVGAASTSAAASITTTTADLVIANTCQYNAYYTYAAPWTALAQATEPVKKAFLSAGYQNQTAAGAISTPDAGSTTGSFDCVAIAAFHLPGASFTDRGSLLSQGQTKGAFFKNSASQVDWEQTADQLPTSVLQLDTVQIYGMVASGGSGTFYREGVADGTVTYAGYTPDTLGANFVGDVFEVIAYDRAVTSGERAQIRNYLKGVVGGLTTDDVAGSGSGIRMFKSTSTWNKAIPASPALDANSATIISALSANSIIRSGQSGVRADPTQFTIPVYEAPPGASKLQVYAYGNYCNTTAEHTANVTHPFNGNVLVPLPVSAQASDGSDANCACADWNTGEYWDMHLFTNPDDTISVAVAAGAAVSIPLNFPATSWGNANQDWNVGQTVTINPGGATQETATITSIPDATHIVVNTLAHAHSVGEIVRGMSCSNISYYNVDYDAIPAAYGNNGSSNPYSAGLVRGWEGAAGAISHRLTFFYSNPTATHILPALSSDQLPQALVSGAVAAGVTSFPIRAYDGVSFFNGYQLVLGYGTPNQEYVTVNTFTTTTLTLAAPTTKTHADGDPIYAADAMPEGTTIQLDPAFDTTTLPDAITQTIAKALQTYGAVCTNGGGHFKLAIEDVHTAAWGSGGLPAVSQTNLNQIPLNRFRVLAPGV